MSFKQRLIWVCPAILLASWLAVRALAVAQAEDLGDPPPIASLASLASVTRAPEIHDPALSQLIAHFAKQARAARR